MSKRANGEATIYQDENGRWHGWITVGTKANGKLDRRHRTGRTRTEVTQKIRELEVHRETGTITAANADTVTGWLDHWLTNIAARRVRPRTLESYESMIRMHVRPHIGSQRLDRLQPEHLEQLYNTLLAKGLSPTTVLRVHRVIPAPSRSRCSAAGCTATSPPSSTHRRSSAAIRPLPSRPKRPSSC